MSPFLFLWAMRLVALITGTANHFHCVPDNYQSKNRQRCNLYGSISIGNYPGHVKHNYKDQGY